MSGSKSKARSRPPPLNGSDLYAVEAILDKKVNQMGKTLYYIKWLGWGNSYNTWEPEENIATESLLQEFEERQRSGQPSKLSHKRRRSSDQSSNAQYMTSASTSKSHKKSQKSTPTEPRAKKPKKTKQFSYPIDTSLTSSSTTTPSTLHRDVSYESNVQRIIDKLNNTGPVFGGNTSETTSARMLRSRSNSRSQCSSRRSSVASRRNSLLNSTVCDYEVLRGCPDPGDVQSPVSSLSEYSVVQPFVNKAPDTCSDFDSDSTADEKIVDQNKTENENLETNKNICTANDGNNKMNLEPQVVIERLRLPKLVLKRMLSNTYEKPSYEVSLKTVSDNNNNNNNMLNEDKSNDLINNRKTKDLLINDKTETVVDNNTDYEVVDNEEVQSIETSVLIDNIDANKDDNRLSAIAIDNVITGNDNDMSQSDQNNDYNNTLISESPITIVETETIECNTTVNDDEDIEVDKDDNEEDIGVNKNIDSEDIVVDNDNNDEDIGLNKNIDSEEIVVDKNPNEIDVLDDDNRTEDDIDNRIDCGINDMTALAVASICSPQERQTVKYSGVNDLQRPIQRLPHIRVPHDFVEEEIALKAIVCELDTTSVNQEEELIIASADDDLIAESVVTTQSSQLISLTYDVTLVCNDNETVVVVDDDSADNNDCVDSDVAEVIEKVICLVVDEVNKNVNELNEDNDQEFNDNDDDQLNCSNNKELKEHNDEENNDNNDEELNDQKNEKNNDNNDEENNDNNDEELNDQKNEKNNDNNDEENNDNNDEENNDNNYEELNDHSNEISYSTDDDISKDNSPVSVYNSYNKSMETNLIIRLPPLSTNKVYDDSNVEEQQQQQQSVYNNNFVSITSTITKQFSNNDDIQKSPLEVPLIEYKELHHSQQTFNENYSDDNNNDNIDNNNINSQNNNKEINSTNSNDIMLNTVITEVNGDLHDSIDGQSAIGKKLSDATDDLPALVTAYSPVSPVSMDLSPVATTVDNNCYTGSPTKSTSVHCDYSVGSNYILDNRLNRSNLEPLFNQHHQQQQLPVQPIVENVSPINTLAVDRRELNNHNINNNNSPVGGPTVSPLYDKSYQIGGNFNSTKDISFRRSSVDLLTNSLSLISRLNPYQTYGDKTHDLFLDYHSLDIFNDLDIQMSSSSTQRQPPSPLPPTISSTGSQWQHKPTYDRNSQGSNYTNCYDSNPLINTIPAHSQMTVSQTPLPLSSTHQQPLPPISTITQSMSTSSMLNYDNISNRLQNFKDKSGELQTTSNILCDVITGRSPLQDMTINQMSNQITQSNHNIATDLRNPTPPIITNLSHLTRTSRSSYPQQMISNDGLVADASNWPLLNQTNHPYQSFRPPVTDGMTVPSMTYSNQYMRHSTPTHGIPSTIQSNIRSPLTQHSPPMMPSLPTTLPSTSHINHPRKHHYNIPQPNTYSDSIRRIPTHMINNSRLDSSTTQHFQSFHMRNPPSTHTTSEHMRSSMLLPNARHQMPNVMSSMGSNGIRPQTQMSQSVGYSTHNRPPPPYPSLMRSSPLPHTVVDHNINRLQHRMPGPHERPYNSYVNTSTIRPDILTHQRMSHLTQQQQRHPYSMPNTMSYCGRLPSPSSVPKSIPNNNNNVQQQHLTPTPLPPMRTQFIPLPAECHQKRITVEPKQSEEVRKKIIEQNYGIDSQQYTAVNSFKEQPIFNPYVQQMTNFDNNIINIKDRQLVDHRSNLRPQICDNRSSLPLHNNHSSDYRQVFNSQMSNQINTNKNNNNNNTIINDSHNNSITRHDLLQRLLSEGEDEDNSSSPKLIDNEKRLSLIQKHGYMGTTGSPVPMGYPTGYENKEHTIQANSNLNKAVLNDVPPPLIRPTSRSSISSASMTPPASAQVNGHKDILTEAMEEIELSYPCDDDIVVEESEKSIDLNASISGDDTSSIPASTTDDNQVIYFCADGESPENLTNEQLLELLKNNCLRIVDSDSQDTINTRKSEDLLINDKTDTVVDNTTAYEMVDNEEIQNIETSVSIGNIDANKDDNRLSAIAIDNVITGNDNDMSQSDQNNDYNNTLISESPITIVETETIECNTTVNDDEDIEVDKDDNEEDIGVNKNIDSEDIVVDNDNNDEDIGLNKNIDSEEIVVDKDSNEIDVLDDDNRTEDDIDNRIDCGINDMTALAVASICSPQERQTVKYSGVNDLQRPIQRLPHIRVPHDFVEEEIALKAIVCELDTTSVNQEEELIIASADDDLIAESVVTTQSSQLISLTYDVTLVCNDNETVVVVDDDSADNNDCVDSDVAEVIEKVICLVVDEVNKNVDELNENNEQELNDNNDDQLNGSNNEELKENIDEELNNQKNEENNDNNDEELNDQKNEDNNDNNDEENNDNNDEELNDQKNEKNNDNNYEELNDQKNEDNNDNNDEDLNGSNNEELKEHNDEELNDQKNEENNDNNDEELNYQKNEENNDNNDEELNDQNNEISYSTDDDISKDNSPVSVYNSYNKSMETNLIIRLPSLSTYEVYDDSNVEEQQQQQSVYNNNFVSITTTITKQFSNNDDIQKSPLEVPLIEYKELHHSQQTFNENYSDDNNNDNIDNNNINSQNNNKEINSTNSNDIMLNTVITEVNGDLHDSIDGQSAIGKKLSDATDELPIIVNNNKEINSTNSNNNSNSKKRLHEVPLNYIHPSDVESNQSETMEIRNHLLICHKKKKSVKSAKRRKTSIKLSSKPPKKSMSVDEEKEILQLIRNRLNGWDRGWTANEIVGINSLNDTLVFLVKWSNGQQTIVLSEVAKHRCPQLVIKFYERHSVWDDEDDNE